MQYEALRVDQCQNKEKHKLLAERVWFQGTFGPSISKCGRARQGSEQVGGASANLLSFTTVQLCLRFVTALLNSLSLEEFR